MSADTQRLDAQLRAALGLPSPKAAPKPRASRNKPSPVDGAALSLMPSSPAPTPRPAVVQRPAPTPAPPAVVAGLLNTRQAAAILGVSTATVYDLSVRGELPRVGMSGKGKPSGYLRADVEALAAARQASVRRGPKTQPVSSMEMQVPLAGHREVGESTAPAWTIAVGTCLITDGEVWRAISAGTGRFADFVLVVSEGQPIRLLAVEPDQGIARPLGPWEVALCRIRRGYRGWIAAIPPMGPTHHPRALSVARWAHRRMGARGEVSA